EKKALYHKIYRLMKSWEKDGLIEIHRVNSLLFTKPRRVDLILKLAVFKPDKRVELLSNRSNGSRRCDGVKLPVRLHEVRRFAIENLLLKKIEFSTDDWRFLDLLFKSYLDDVEGKVIVLRNIEDGSFLLLPYKHRFKYVRKYLRKYDDLWNFFSRYSVGVFMTFTVDPSQYKNLWEVSREVPKAFNRFKSWLKKRLGFNPRHICVYEFQDNGRLHLHVILFGVSRIGDKFTEITPELVRIGFGKINYLYKIVNRGGGWVWVKEKPGGGGPREYLRKYLIKSLVSDVSNSSSDDVGKGLAVYKLSMYWATGKRFFSYSRIEGVKVEVVRGRGLYEFVGVFDVLDVEYFLENAVGPPVYT
ncbi:MAG: hypothetical protein QXQ91_03965, partial [Nanopusillaceae archaeon]